MEVDAALESCRAEMSQVVAGEVQAVQAQERAEAEVRRERTLESGPLRNLKQ